MALTEEDYRSVTAPQRVGLQAAAVLANAA